MNIKEETTIDAVYTLEQNNANRITLGGITRRTIKRISETHFVFLDENSPPQSIEKWSNCDWIKII